MPLASAPNHPNGMAKQRRRGRVLLVKEPKSSSNNESEDAPAEWAQDPYSQALNASYDVDFLPALTHTLSNQDRLMDIIKKGCQNLFSGVVFTSQRAVEAWSVASKTVAEASEAANDWNKLPFYVVGPATASALLVLQSPHVPKSTLILGQDSGNAERLARYIVAMHSKEAYPLLYLVGDKRRATLADILAGNQIAVQEIEVYRTQPSPTFAADFHDLRISYDWIVFFSPSGAKLMLPLRKGLPSTTQFAVIGPTTRDFLRDIPEMTVTAMAEEPSPEALLKALTLADGLS
jgi:uroporphyrinogen-III synthase